MSTVKFLLDEHIPTAIGNALVRHEPGIEFLKVGAQTAPPTGTPDPELLVFCESLEFALVTQDFGTMPDHVANHLAREQHTWGVFLLRRGFPPMAYASTLILIWAASSAEEWQDRVEWIPL